MAATQEPTPADVLHALAQRAVALAKTARKARPPVWVPADVLHALAQRAVALAKTARKARPPVWVPADVLHALAQRAVALAKTARKHRQNLRSDNFYGNKLVELRADAINAFRQLATRAAGDSSALAELVE